MEPLKQRFEMMDWIPIVLITFKVLVLGMGMFFAVKWHYDQEAEKRRAVLHAVGKLVAVFVLLLLGMLLFTFVLGKKLGLDLRLP